MTPLCPPSGDNGTTSIGQSDKRWLNLFLAGSLSDGSNYVSASQLKDAVDRTGTTAVTAGTYSLTRLVVDAYGRLTYAANGTDQTGGGGGGTNLGVWEFSAAAFDSPVSASWAVNALAACTVDGTTGQAIRAFSGTAEEGVGWGPYLIPYGAGTMRWTVHQAKDTSGNGSTVLKLYSKRFPYSAAAGTWSSVLLDMTTTSGTFYQYFSGNQTVAANDWAAGTYFWWQLTRASTHGSDTFAGVLDVDSFKMEWF